MQLAVKIFAPLAASAANAGRPKANVNAAIVSSTIDIIFLKVVLLDSTYPASSKNLSHEYSIVIQNFDILNLCQPLKLQVLHGIEVRRVLYNHNRRKRTYRLYGFVCPTYASCKPLP